MGNNIFQRAKEAVSNLVGKNEEGQHTQQQRQDEQISQQKNDFSNDDISVAENIISSAMADSSDAERQQLAELQQELDQTKNSTKDQL
ncbi:MULTISPECIES: DUF3813 domain-containing protein [Fictibacillus]|uniref:DUF3813 domain-containing protein n=1 Tax=Fictibacillus terranigra TaxID=3058424 RepID=A0ABT8E778_9BACL|nr:DUF3813 domain-containing protein [Fictibacillus sp. CENA-BCM004]MDN4073729.1 DUF3813 domain-containing protein [Fictibacillus sp. CENA-BCM004]